MEIQKNQLVFFDFKQFLRKLENKKKRYFFLNIMVKTRKAKEIENKIKKPKAIYFNDDYYSKYFEKYNFKQ